MSGGTIRRIYGESALHLLALLAAFVLAAYAAVRVVPRDPIPILAWFVGGAILHDLAFFWLVSVGDALAGRIFSSRSGTAVPALNHVRVPAFLSGLLLLVWFPLILRLPSSFEASTGYTTAPYLGRWLLITAALFSGSGALYAVRLGRAVARRPRETEER